MDYIVYLIKKIHDLFALLSLACNVLMGIPNVCLVACVLSREPFSFAILAKTPSLAIRFACTTPQRVDIEKSDVT